jgi:glucosamine--fructose-6-phosphate aminotransferase (isomerizing)
MCGIVGYFGPKNAYDIILNGLKRLEYRGYDSAGIALLNGSGSNVTLFKEKGKIENLEKAIGTTKLTGNLGIGHTRWATHGEPSQINAHPHLACNGKLALIHNGIIENYKSLKKMLMDKGYEFVSETDTEVIAKLIEFYLDNNFEIQEAFRRTLNKLEGAYGLVVIHSDYPNMILGAREGSPLVIGLGEGEYFIASDASAIVSHTKNVIYLDDKEMVVVDGDSYRTRTIDNRETEKAVKTIEFDLQAIEKAGFEHFMLKEIFEQPKTIEDAMRGRLIDADGVVKLGGLNEIQYEVLKAKRILITACGTSWHAALLGEYLLEELCRVPVEVEYASEFRYRNPVVTEDTLVIVISQSGETADTLAALREAKRKGAMVMGLVNVVGSTIARETDGGVYLHAGPEIGVASTKAFTSQVTLLVMLAIYIARTKDMSMVEGKRVISALREIPNKVQKILDEVPELVESIARNYNDKQNFLYLGRGYNFPVALEGALKLKEISYIHAEGYPAAEMKHGPIALIDENMPVVFIATKDAIYEKVLSNIEEVNARKGKVIAIATEGDDKINDLADHVIYIPDTEDFLIPLLSIIPLQLLSYYAAVQRGCDVDKPRNLAKSVTVE